MSEKKHREMTSLCHEELCLFCGCVPSEPAHHPFHRGMGGADLWTVNDVVPLCRTHHDMLDHRNGASRAACLESDIVTAVVTAKAVVWRDRFRSEDD